MKKIINILFAFILVISSGYSQTSQKAKSYLDQVSKTLSSYKNVSIDFTYTSHNTASQDISQKGHIDIQKDLYVLDFMGIKKIYDGKKIYTISTEDEEVTVSNLNKNKADGILPSDMLTFFKEGFSYQWDITATVKGKKIQYIKLIPTDKNSGIKDILLGIEDATKNIFSQVQTGKDGSKMVLSVNSFETNQTLSKNHFTFTASKYPNYYINTID
ncbi:outer membrane lipoprotein carrier protein LolA [Myroides pelagicus]|uniref:LolA family protein n=1 Tax=Myroides pelagicus TaxID=270914 RepID=UPI002DBA29A6|nr:outer membrane lipoprotein carrier protein LolA [Myroides pelagicus]MEC4113338.1 outer membrane lipoprotein carrier protein LolA [Myroides pelagicus]